MAALNWLTPATLLQWKPLVHIPNLIFKSRPRIVQSHHLAFYEKHLPEDQFIRVHRSSIINTAEIKSINRTNKTLILTNDHNIKYSIRKWGLIKHLIETEKR